MKNKRFEWFLILFFILLLAGFFGFENYIVIASSSNVLINEIQVAGIIANDEFIELYNLSDGDVDISSWSIQYKGGSGTKYYRKNFTNGSKIESHGYFLIAHGSFSGNVVPDMRYSTFGLAGTVLGTGGTVFLVRSQSDLDKVNPDTVTADKVGYGITDEFESSMALKPESGKSIERINFADTDNNYEDFHLLESPTPQNSSWQGELDENNGSNDEDIGNTDGNETACISNSNYVKLNEIYPNTENASEEFVEIFNNGENCANIAEWTIKDDANHKHKISANTYLASGDYFYVEKNLYLNNGEDVVYLLNENGDEKDKRSYEKAQRGQAYGFNGIDWEWTTFPTPGKANKFPEKKTYSSGIYFNEALPNPKGKDEDREYLEFYNSGELEEDLIGWKLKDKNGKKYVLEKKNEISLKIKPGGYLVINPNDYGVALHNTVDENIELLDPNSNSVSKLSYKGKGIKENVSYNFDGQNWRWSNKLTPGEKNKFNSTPEIKKKTDKNFYVNVYADFSAEGYDKDKDNLKFTWDFGDGHKSYKKETRHKYEKAGKYKVALKVSDGSEDTLKTFDIKVNKYPKRSVKITSVSPNPKGKDAENEFIVVKNNSTKKVNLKNWSIATGSKKLANHPIRDNLVIKPGKTAVITRADSKFTLHNKKARVELRYPDGKVASKIKYDKKKESVSEDELYSRVNGKWRWEKPEKSEVIAAEPEKAPEINILTAPTEEEENIILVSGKSFTENPDFGKNFLADSINQRGYVLGTFTFRSHSSRRIDKEQSYFNALFLGINSVFNSIINNFSKLFFYSI